MSNILIEKNIPIPNRNNSGSSIKIEKGIPIPINAMEDKRKFNNKKLFFEGLEVGDSFLYRSSDNKLCCSAASAACGRFMLRFPDREYKWAVWNNQIRIWRTK